MGKLFFLMLSAAAAGLIGWAIAEPMAPKSLYSSQWAQYGIIYGLLIGGCIGGALGGVSGWFQGSRAHFFRGFFGGMALGAVGGYAGILLGGALASALFGEGVFQNPNAAFLTRVVARLVAFIPFGAFVGSVVGIGTRSMPRAIQGAIGGLIGGAIAGSTFDIIGEVFGSAILAARGELQGEVGIVSRAVTSVVIGAAIGLLLGIVEMVSKRAWVRLELGRNEGKEWIVDAPQTFIGRSENAHIPLFGDQNVMPMHACIVRSGRNYRLVDGGSQMGIGVNGYRVPEAILNDGDVINVGSYQLRFLLRDKSHAAVQRDYRPQAPPAGAPLPPPPDAPAPAQAAAGSTHYALVAIDGPLAGQRFAVNSGELVIGREAAGVALGFDQSASRKHASFCAAPGGVLVRDLGSTNGTIVNGVRVQEMSLRPGDTVKIGSTTFRLE